MAWSGNKIPQMGIALLAGLILLSALSLLAITAASGMVQQQRMSGNYEDKQFSHQASVHAASQGERFLYQLESHQREAECLLDCYSPPLDTIIHPLSEQSLYPALETDSWWNNLAWEAGIDPLTGFPVGESWQFASPTPRFFIEELYYESYTSSSTPEGAPSLDGIAYYRVLGRGTGLDSLAISVSESIIALPWPQEAQNSTEGIMSENSPLSAFNESGFCSPYEEWYDCGKMSWRTVR